MTGWLYGWEAGFSENKDQLQFELINYNIKDEVGTIMTNYEHLTVKINSGVSFDNIHYQTI